jgi:hypothetical protein
MENYDLTQQVEYETDDEYRKCLLTVFGLNQYGSELIDRIDALRTLVTHPPLLETALRLGTGLDPELGFFMLFSYDEFKNTHTVLKTVLKHSP